MLASVPDKLTVLHSPSKAVTVEDQKDMYVGVQQMRGQT